jgi:ABC-type dipeptide/oligopeptide/nickel transport system permease subunit
LTLALPVAMGCCNLFISFISMSNVSFSFQQAAWRRLRKNKGAMFGLVIIAIAILVAVFAYFIAPDSSSYANRIILEIGGEKPGYKQIFIKVQKDKTVAPASFLKQLISGKEDA